MRALDAIISLMDPASESPAAPLVGTPGQSADDALLRSMPVMLHSIDAAGRIVSVSDLWLERLGYRREQVLGRSSLEFLTPESRRRAQEVVLPAFFATGHCADVPYQMLRNDGRVMDILLSAVLQRDAEGRPRRSIAVLQDVTEARRAEAALLDERQRLAHLIEATQCGTWEWNMRTGEIRINDKWAEVLGYRAEEVEPLTVARWTSMMHPDDRRHAKTTLDRHIAGELPGYVCETRMRHRDGHWVWVLDRGRITTWTAEGEPEWVYGTHLDITRRREQEEELRKSQEFLNRTGDVAGVGGWLVDLLELNVVWSDQTCRLHGMPPGYQPTFEEAASFYPPGIAEKVHRSLRDNVARGCTHLDTELPRLRADGSMFWVRSVSHIEYVDGRAARIWGAFQDVTEARRLKAELAEQHERLRVTLQSIADAVITTDAGGIVTWMNPVAERLTGWCRAQAAGRELASVFRTVDTHSRALLPSPVEVCLNARPVPQAHSEALLLSSDGREYGIEESASPIRSDAGRVLGVVLVFRDVTEQRRMTREMSYRARHDALTGLVNRSEFEQRLTQALESAQNNGAQHALLYIDLDQFKLVNDSCGHTVGDKLLQQVGKLMQTSVRTRDVVARLGGDEFALILHGCGIDDAQRIAQQICDQLDDVRFTHEGRSFRIGCSIGLVPIDERWTTPSAILQAADSACYAAKEAGRNRVHTWFDSDADIRLRHGEMQWATQVEAALDDNRLVLHAQRIESCVQRDDGVHAEVLVRLQLPDGTLAYPGAFLPAAERFHLASRLDRWVLNRAVEWLRAVSDREPIRLLAVNLSGQSIGDRAFHRRAIELLRDAGPDICRRLCLEITETAAVTSIADAASFVEQVRAFGVQVALDDFGVGASSFGYLKKLTVDWLKIDGSFVQDLLDDALDEAAVRSFTEVARVVGVKTVAEFVDRPELLERLKLLGVDFAQGYLLHRPEPIDALLGD